MNPALAKKAARLVREGRVRRVDARTYQVRGDSGTHCVTYPAPGAPGKPRCACPANTFRSACSHILATTAYRAHERAEEGPTTMTNVPAKVEPREAALAERMGINPEKLHLIRQQIAPNAPDDVLELYFERCRVAGADPFSRMFYATSRKVRNGEDWETRWNIETTIDGFRSIAESTGEYDGQDEPLFQYDKNGRLQSCKVTVYRKGMGRGVTAVAFWNEYVQTNRNGEPGPMWTKMPHGQLAKCAEALALRKAFPRQLSGLYTNDEMAQSENPAQHRSEKAAAAAPKATERSAEPQAVDADFTEEPKDRARELKDRFKALYNDPRLLRAERDEAVSCITGDPAVSSIVDADLMELVIGRLEVKLAATQEIPF